jgi:GNAT superfamily N-acetyltransferase
MTEYIIRDATQNDVLDTVLAVKQFCKEIPHPAWHKFNTNKVNSLVSQLIEIDHGFVKIVTYEDEVVGALVAVLSDIPINDLIFAQELMFWIDPEHRKGKTAIKLVDEYVEWATKAGCNFIRLSELDNVLGGKAGLLFKRKGFEPTETAYIKEV